MVVSAEFEDVHIPDVRIPQAYRQSAHVPANPGSLLHLVEGNPARAVESTSEDNYSTPPPSPSAIIADSPVQRLASVEGLVRISPASSLEAWVREEDTPTTETSHVSFSSHGSVEEILAPSPPAHSFSSDVTASPMGISSPDPSCHATPLLTASSSNKPSANPASSSTSPVTETCSLELREPSPGDSPVTETSNLPSVSPSASLGFSPAISSAGDASPGGSPTTGDLEASLSEIEGIISSIDEPVEEVSSLRGTSPLELVLKPVPSPDPSICSSDTSTYMSTPVVPAFVVNKVTVTPPPAKPKPLISITILRHEEVLIHTDIGGDIPNFDELPTEIPDELPSELPVDVEIPPVDIEVPGDHEGTRMINIRPEDLEKIEVALVPEEIGGDVKSPSALDKFFRRFSSFSAKDIPAPDDVTITPPCVEMGGEALPVPEVFATPEYKVEGQGVFAAEPLPHYPPDKGLAETLIPPKTVSPEKSLDSPGVGHERKGSLFDKFVDAFSKESPPEAGPQSANDWQLPPSEPVQEEFEWSAEAAPGSPLIVPTVMCCGKGEFTPPETMEPSSEAADVPPSHDSDKKGSMFDKFVDMFNKEDEIEVDGALIMEPHVETTVRIGEPVKPVKAPEDLPPLVVEAHGCEPLQEHPPIQEVNPSAPPLEEPTQPALMELHSEGSLYGEDPGLKQSPFSAQPAVEAIGEFFSNILPKPSPEDHVQRLPTPVLIIKPHSPLDSESELSSMASSSAEQLTESEGPSERASPLFSMLKRLGSSSDLIVEEPVVPQLRELTPLPEPLPTEDVEMVIEEPAPEPEKKSEFVNHIMGIFSMPKRAEERLPSPAEELPVESSEGITPEEITPEEIAPEEITPEEITPVPPISPDPIHEEVEMVIESPAEPEVKPKPEVVFVNHILGMFSKRESAVIVATPPAPPAPPAPDPAPPTLHSSACTLPPPADEIEVESMTSTMQPSPVHPSAPDTMSEVAPPSLPSEKGGIGGLLGKIDVTFFGKGDDVTVECEKAPVVPAEPIVVTALDPTAAVKKDVGGKLGEFWTGMMKWDILAEKQAAEVKKGRSIMRLQNSEELEDVEMVTSLTDWVKIDVEKRGERDNDPFIVCDIAQVFERKLQWDNQFPGIIMFYNLDSFNSLSVRVLLNVLHCGFVCSKWTDIENCLRIGVSPQKIVYQQAFKDKSKLKAIVACDILIVCYSKSDIKLVGEISAELGVKSNVLVQLDVSDDKLIKHPVLKGVLPGDIMSIVNEAQRAGVNIIGLSLDLSSGIAKEGCVTAKNIWRELETHCSPSLLHIGGTHSTDPAQDSELLTKVLIECFEDVLYSQQVFVIGDLKGYLSKTAVSLVANVTHCSELQSKVAVQLVVNTEVDPELWDCGPYVVPLSMLEMYKKNVVRPAIHNKTVWDTTLRPPVILDHTFPKLGEGDWVIFPEAAQQTSRVRRQFICTAPHDKAVKNLLNGLSPENAVNAV